MTLIALDHALYFDGLFDTLGNLFEGNVDCYLQIAASLRATTSFP